MGVVIGLVVVGICIAASALLRSAYSTPLVAPSNAATGSVQPPPGSASYPVNGTITLNVCPPAGCSGDHQHIYYTYGGQPGNCVYSPTSTDYTVKTNGEQHQYGFDASEAFPSCWPSAPSYQTFKLVLADRAGGPVIGSGFFWLGQTTGGKPYFSNCNNYTWVGLQCIASGKDLNISLIQKTPTRTIGAAAPNPSIVGQAVRFQALVQPTSKPPDTAKFGGNVQFYVDGEPKGRPVPVPGQGGWATSDAFTDIGEGAHPVTATYLGNDFFSSSTSPLLYQVVNPKPAR